MNDYLYDAVTQKPKTRVHQLIDKLYSEDASHLSHVDKLIMIYLAAKDEEVAITKRDFSSKIGSVSVETLSKKMNRLSRLGLVDIEISNKKAYHTSHYTLTEGNL